MLFKIAEYFKDLVFNVFPNKSQFETDYLKTLV